MVKVIALSLVIFALSGCSTPYQQSGFRGGFHEIQLTESSYQIEFKGNAYTRSETTRDFAVLRGAELCIGSGYTHYTILGAGDLSRTQTVTSNSPSSTTGNINQSGYFQATTTGGSKTQTITKPGTAIAVQCLEESEGAIDAQSTIRHLKAKYQIDQIDTTQ